MATTSLGLVYPDATGHDRIWEHIQNLATSANTYLAAKFADTGWLALTGIVAGWSSTASVRQIGNRIYFRGSLTNSSFTNTTYTTIATLPGGISLPTAAKIYGINSTSGSTKAIQVTTAGTVQAYSTAATSTPYSVDVITYLSD
jgi:hypothetical protein